MSGAQHAALRLESALGNAGWMRQLRALYGTAFPSEERVPFFYLLRKAKKGAAECLAALDGDRFVGLAYTVSHKDLVFLFYFAVSDDRRGAGYGTAVLEALGHRYSGKLQSYMGKLLYALFYRRIRP